MNANHLQLFSFGLLVLVLCGLGEVSAKRARGDEATDDAERKGKLCK